MRSHPRRTGQRFYGLFKNLFAGLSNPITDLDGVIEDPGIRTTTVTRLRRMFRGAKRGNMPTIVRGENVRRLRASARLSECGSIRDPSGQRRWVAVRTFSGVLSRFAKRDVRRGLLRFEEEQQRRGLLT